MAFYSENPEIVRYLEKSQAVIDSSRAVANAFDSKHPAPRREAEISVAIDLLKDSLAEIQGEPVARAGFAAREDEVKSAPRLSLEEKLAVAAADATTAQVLFAASKAVGETADRAGAEPLRAVLQIVDADAAPVQSVQHFREASHIRSADAAHAMATFRAQAARSLEQVVQESAELIEKIFGYLAEKTDTLVEAFGLKDQLLELRQQAAPLLRSAWEKLLSALRSLREMVEQVHDDEAKKQLTELVQSATLSAALGGLFGRPAVNALLQGFETATYSDPEPVDKLSDQLASLEERFRTLVSYIKRIDFVVALSGSLIAAHITGPFGVLAAPAAHSLAILGVVVLGRDFVQQGHLNSGSGIATILGQFEQLGLSTGVS